MFLSEICNKVIDPVKLKNLQDEIIITLCQLEMYFPPSFFDIMVHLVVHLVREIQLCGPAFLRYMYPIERYMKILKGYVNNRSHPEDCIVERALIKESIEFCIKYLANVDAIGIPKTAAYNVIFHFLKKKRLYAVVFSSYFMLRNSKTDTYVKQQISFFH